MSTAGRSKRPSRRYHLSDVSFVVGVVKRKENGVPRRRPATLSAEPSTVPAYAVERGSGVAGSGVKTSTVVPDQRNSPLTAGVRWIQGGVGFDGTRPSATIGSEKMTRISLASLSWFSSPLGDALTMRS